MDFVIIVMPVILIFIIVAITFIGIIVLVTIVIVTLPAKGGGAHSTREVTAHSQFIYFSAILLYWMSVGPVQLQPSRMRPFGQELTESIPAVNKSVVMPTISSACSWLLALSVAIKLGQLPVSKTESWFSTIDILRCCLAILRW